jgi:hypothetical protein
LRSDIVEQAGGAARRVPFDEAPVLIQERLLRVELEFAPAANGSAGVRWPAAKKRRGIIPEAALAIAANPFPVLERKSRLPHREALFIFRNLSVPTLFEQPVLDR